MNINKYSVQRTAYSVLVFLLVCLETCFAQAASSTELINQADHYDGQTVVYEGEVIGDIMMRSDFAWLNVHDGENSIGVWASRELARDITCAGSYQFRGDIIQVSGIFHRACLEHGGDLDIHAESIEIIKPGREFNRLINTRKLNFVIILFGILILVWILRRFK
jgi:hypothetical protein